MYLFVVWHIGKINNSNNYDDADSNNSNNNNNNNNYYYYYYYYLLLLLYIVILYTILCIVVVNIIKEYKYLFILATSISYKLGKVFLTILTLFGWFLSNNFASRQLSRQISASFS